MSTHHIVGCLLLQSKIFVLTLMLFIVIMKEHLGIIMAIIYVDMDNVIVDFKSALRKRG